MRNNTEFHVNPTWYFTSKELSEYMPVAVGKKWSSSTVASKLEAFAIAGCDVISASAKFSVFSNMFDQIGYRS